MGAKTGYQTRRPLVELSANESVMSVKRASTV